MLIYHKLTYQKTMWLWLKITYSICFTRHLKEKYTVANIRFLMIKQSPNWNLCYGLHIWITNTVVNLAVAMHLLALLKHYYWFFKVTVEVQIIIPLLPLINPVSRPVIRPCCFLNQYQSFDNFTACWQWYVVEVPFI